LGRGVVVGPFCEIGPGVSVDDGYDISVTDAVH